MFRWLKIGNEVYKQIILFACLICLLVSSTVIFGWLTNNPILVQVNPSFAPMQFNTALCFLLSSLAALFLLFNFDAVSKTLAVCVGAITFFTLLQYILKINLGIDELFFNHYITVKTSHVGRMAPNTAFSFFVFSTSLLLPKSKLSFVSISGVLGSLVFALGFAAFVGYIIGLDITYNWGAYTNMAIHTSFCFMLLGISETLFSLIYDSELTRGKNNAVRPWAIGYIISLALGIFLIDLSAPLGAAVGIIYILLILVGWFLPGKRGIVILSAISCTLIILGYIYSPSSGQENWIVLFNRILSIIAICIASILLLVIKRNRLLQYELIAKLREQKLELERQNKEINQFLFISSHHLQEPLRAINIYSGMFQEKRGSNSDDLEEQSLKYMVEAAGKMSELIKGLRQYSTAGRIDESFQQIDCNVLLSQIFDELATEMQNTETEINIGNLPLIVGYKHDIKLLFLSLIKNAISFTNKSTKPQIEIKGVSKLNFWQFAIKDNGLGIDERYFEKVFEIFQKLENDENSKGIGIGLALCKKIVELHGGKIWIVKNNEQGSTFYFTIKKQ